jgi:hypothetical protein
MLQDENGHNITHGTMGEILDLAENQTKSLHNIVSAIGSKDPNGSRRSQNCPTSSPYHKMISGSCYYLETRKMSFSRAKQNCLHQFGSSATGQLFEPRNLAINEAVHREAQNTFSPADFWLGITDKKDQKYRYESDGTEVPMDQGTNGMWENNQPNDLRYLRNIYHFISF